MSETVLMFDMKTKERVNVPVEKVQESFSSGKYGFEGDRRVPITLPDGKDGWVSAYELDAVIKGGGSYDFQRTKKIDELEYGGRNVEAALLGAARGATLGLSDVLLSSTIYTPSELNKIRETNPNLSLAGEVGGGIGSIVMTGGAGAAFKSGQLAKGAGLAVLSPSRKVAETAAMVGNTITKGKRGVAATALNLGIAGGIEGAAYGVQSAITESALGNADLNAELLLSSVGTGIGTGAGFGAALGGAVSGVAGVYRGGKMVLGKASDYATAKYHGLEIETAQKLREAPQEALDLVQNFDKVSRGPAQAATDMVNSFHGVEKQLRTFHAGGGKRSFIRDSMLKDPTVPGGKNFDELTSQDLLKESHEEAVKILNNIVERADDPLLRAEIGVERLSLIKKLSSNLADKKFEVLYDRTLKAPSKAQVQDDMHKLFMDVDNLRVQLSQETFERGVSQFRQEYDALSDFLKKSTFFGEDIAGKQSVYLAAYSKFLETSSAIKAVKFSTKPEYVGRSSITGKDEFYTPREASLDDMINRHSKSVDKESREQLELLHSTYTDFANATLNIYGGAKGFEAVKAGMESVLDNGAKYKTILKGEFSPDGKLAEGADPGFLNKSIEKEKLSKIKSGSDFYAARLAAYALPSVLGAPGVSAAMAAVDGIQNPIRRARLLAAVQRFVESAKDKLGIQSKAVKKALSEETSTPKPSNRQKLFNNMLGIFAGADVSQDIKKKKKEGDRRAAAELAYRLSDPQTVASIVDKKLKGVEDYAPETKNAAALKMTNALQQIALAARLTTKVRQDPLTGKTEVIASESDLDRFEGIVQMIGDPIGSTTKKISDGTITREEVSALKSVYPMLYAELVGNISDHVADPKTKVSYSKKIVLSTVLGVPLSPYMEPQYVMIMQGLQEGAQPPGPAPRRDIRGLSGLANNELTPSLKALT